MADQDSIDENTEVHRKETLKWARSMSEHSNSTSNTASTDKKVYSIESALELIGGFGKS